MVNKKVGQTNTKQTPDIFSDMLILNVIPH